MLLSALGLTVLPLAIPFRMLWLTRLAAVPGLYNSSGVWGRATLRISPDGGFKEDWKFANECSNRREGESAIEGRWEDSGRDWLTRNIYFQPFQGLASYDRGHPPRSSLGNVMAYGGRTVIEVDTGSDIVFVK